MTILGKCRQRANRLGLKVKVLSREGKLYREKRYKYKVGKDLCRNLAALSKAITKLERKKRRKILSAKLNGQRLKYGYTLVKRKKRRKGKRIGNAHSYKEMILGIFKPESIIDEVNRKGGIKDSPAVRTFGKYSNLPRSVRKKTGLALDEMADELYMSDDELWQELAYG